MMEPSGSAPGVSRVTKTRTFEIDAAASTVRVDAATRWGELAPALLLLAELGDTARLLFVAVAQLAGEQHEAEQDQREVRQDDEGVREHLAGR